MHHVAVAHDVLFAFGRELACIAALGLAAELHEVLPPDDLGLDEAALEVGVDDAGGLGGEGALRDRPGANFLHAGREIRREAQQLVAGADDGVEARLGQADAGEEVGAVLRVELGDLRFERGADGDDAGVLGLGVGEQRLVVLVRVELGERVFGDVGHVEHGLRRQQHHLAHDRRRLQVVRNGVRAGGLAGVEVRGEAFAERDGGLLDGGIRLRHLAGFFEARVHGLEVLQAELGLDRRDVADGVDAVLDVDDVRILETADDVGDGVDLADVGEELVAEAFTLAGAADEACDVDEANRRGQRALGVDDLGQGVDARIGNGDDAHVRLDRAEGVVGRLGVTAQRVEEGALTDVRKAHDAA